MALLDLPGLQKQIQCIKTYVDQTVDNIASAITNTEIQNKWSTSVPAATEDLYASKAYVQAQIENAALQNASISYVQSAIANAKESFSTYVNDYGLLPIGHEYFSMNPHVPDGSLPLLGGEYNRETYSELWAWVLRQTDYIKSELEWQELFAENNGNVPFYSYGDGETTFRVPSLHCWIKGSDGTNQLVGSYLEAGLPNIEGLAPTSYAAIRAGSTGAFTGSSLEGGSEQSSTPFPNNYSSGKLIFNASNSNSIYGNADTVVPESIIGMWLVKAYGTVINSGDIEVNDYVDAKISEQFATNVPPGCVQAFAGTTIPEGWLLCDGSAISRSQYGRLFMVIGTSYGAGDGETTFNIPNLVDRFIQGVAANEAVGTERAAGLPNITGVADGNFLCSTTGDTNTTFATGKGSGALRAYTKQISNKYAYSSGSYWGADVGLDASASNAIYGNSTTVQPPSVVMNYIIKY